MEKGNLSIHSENILPIIKKWLYSDTDIFVRELVSNGADAIAKLRKLVDLGEATNIDADEKYAITVRIDKDAKTLTFEDNGIGMTADEIKEYITQIAFSGASAFLEKYQDKAGMSDSAESQIIGHFGLGFYSSFMVADKVEIDSLSWQDGAAAAHWVSDGGIEYEMTDSARQNRGTAIILHITDEHSDFLEEYKLRGILTKYCNFMPVEIFLATEEPAAEEPQAETSETAEPTEEESEKAAPSPINDTNPLWMRAPADCTDDEYKAFYRKVFADFNEPLFWIHLNMDYPFRLKGILYFPKRGHELEYVEGQVKLYNNQVFVADNIKEVIPEYLLLLKGVMDCPDLPLNVSRSFLQSDKNVKKMSGYISKKVADKLNSLFKKNRETYQGYWDDISPFIKFGCIKERDFYDKIKAALLYKTTVGDYVNLDEFLERNKDKTDKKIFYVSNEQQQAQYINMFANQGLEAVILARQLDTPFISYIENYETELEFNRIDSDISDNLKADGDSVAKISEEEQKSVEELFKKALGSDKLKVQIEELKSANVSAIMLLSEQSRRMQEMSRNFGGMDGFPNMFENEEALVLNSNNSLVKSLIAIKDNAERAEDAELIACQLYDLALMGLKPLQSDQMTRFIERSNRILERLV